MEEKIESGDIVVIKDGSYMLAITDEGLVDCPKYNGKFIIPGLCNNFFKVLATELILPAENSVNKILNFEEQVNTIIIQDLKNGIIWFCQDFNLNLIKKRNSNFKEEKYEINIFISG